MINSTYYLPYLLPVAKETFLPCVDRRILLLFKKISLGAFVYGISCSYEAMGMKMVSNFNEEKFQPNMEMIYLKTCFAT